MAEGQRDPADDPEAPHYAPTVKRALLITYGALAFGAIVVILGAGYLLMVAPRW